MEIIDGLEELVTSVCVFLKELCWVSVQGCAQDCYIKEVNLPSAIWVNADLFTFRCQKLQYFFFFVKLMRNCDHVTVVILAHRNKNQNCTRQLMREIKHIITYQGMIFFLDRKVLLMSKFLFLCEIPNQMHQ